MRGVDAAQGRGGAPLSRGRLLGGAGVRLGAGSGGHIVALRVGGDGDGLVGRVQVWHRGQRTSPLPVTGHLDPRDGPQQAKTGIARDHLRARARRKSSGSRTLSAVRSARFSTHHDLYLHTKATRVPMPV